MAANSREVVAFRGSVHVFELGTCSWLSNAEEVCPLQFPTFHPQLSRGTYDAYNCAVSKREREREYPRCLLCLAPKPELIQKVYTLVA